jgi:hypothetical protein
MAAVNSSLAAIGSIASSTGWKARTSAVCCKVLAVSAVGAVMSQPGAFDRRIAGSQKRLANPMVKPCGRIWTNMGVSHVVAR